MLVHTITLHYSTVVLLHRNLAIMIAYQRVKNDCVPMNFVADFRKQKKTFDGPLISIEFSYEAGADTALQSPVASVGQGGVILFNSQLGIEYDISR